MTPEKTNHFLVEYSIKSGRPSVREFGDDYAAAMAAYDELEEATKDDPDKDVVLLIADSIETVKRTHSSYFGESNAFETFLKRALDESVVS